VSAPVPPRVAQGARGLQSYAWRDSYKTSAANAASGPVDLLHDFYVPALQRSVRYDRLAGYFRSTSLAAASRGFSTFVNRGGTLRLIVGADLDPEDVRAILAGDARLLERRLCGELTGRAQWPTAVTRGVDLLAYLVSQGCLEVRVAFHVHRQTGTPLALTSQDDGYVHEKWAVFTDEYGQQLYAAGSLNESQTALTLNAENLEVFCSWWGEHDARRVKAAQEDFERTWQGGNPYLRVMPLPEAVRAALVTAGAQVREPVEVDGSSAAVRRVAPPSAREWLRFALVRDGPKLPGGRFVGMYTAPVEPWPHQEMVARRLVETWPYSFLLCDEVGLGKTIEAGLAIRSLYLAGLARRVLVAPPASLTLQWQREMASKFLLPFARALSGQPPRHAYLHPSEEERPSSSVYAPALSIVSTGLVARRDRRKELQAADPYDIVLIDEAHCATRRNPTAGARAAPEYGQLYQVLRDELRGKTRALWLATATPMQLDPVQVSDLAELTNRVGCFQFDPSLTMAYYQALGQLVRGSPLPEAGWSFLRSTIRPLEQADPFLWRFLQDAVLDARIRMPIASWLSRGTVPHGVDLKNSLRFLFAAAPLSRIMLRHTRPLLEVYRQNNQLGANLATRRILPIPRITFSPAERAAYDDLKAYCDELRRQLSANGRQAERANLQFYLTMLRLRLASSLFAIRQTLARRRERVRLTLEEHLVAEEDEEQPNLAEMIQDTEIEDDRAVVAAFLQGRTTADLQWEYARLERMLEQHGAIRGRPAKTQTLLEVIEQRREARPGRFRQTVVFTRFYDTLTDIRDTLLQVEPHLLLGTYSGQGGQYLDPDCWQLRGAERDEIKNRFCDGEIDVLLCTDAAAEGLNLQTADLLINFDLPWNPMKVEQRIGRIDRIGQLHEEVSVLNLAYADSAEQFVYERLLQRLSTAAGVVGRQQVSLLPVSVEEFDALAAGRLSERELEKRALERVAAQQQRAASMEMPATELFDVYQRITRVYRQSRLPVSLDDIAATLQESTYLAQMGCRTRSSPAGQALEIAGMEGLPHGAVLTTARALHDKQKLDGRQRSIHFASYGDAVFEGLLDHVLRHPPPACVRRLSVRLALIPTEVVGYLVSVRAPDGSTSARLVTCWADTQDLELAEQVSPDADAVSHAEDALRREAEQEFAATVAVKRLEQDNRRAGQAQVVLDCLLAEWLLSSVRTRSSAGDQFWALLAEARRTCADRELSAHPLPADWLRRIDGRVPAELHIPRIGDEGWLPATQPLLEAALELAEREANRMKRKRSECRTDQVLERLARLREQFGDALQ